LLARLILCAAGKRRARQPNNCATEKYDLRIHGLSLHLPL